MTLELPYYPARSTKYKRIWARVKAGSSKQIRAKTFDRVRYNKEYYKRPYVVEKNRRSKARLAVINILGAECVKCGYRDLRALQLDHINGDGSKDNKNRRSSSYYRRMLENPKELFSKFQVLCANCNWDKRYENQESKHTFPYEVN